MSTTLSSAVSEHDHIRGRADALVTWVEYGDYECPSCGGNYSVVKAIQRHLGAGARFVFRNYPLPHIHPRAELAAQAAEAAGAQGKFWEMHDTLFEHQTELSFAQLRSYARAIGLDVTRWEHDMKARTFEPRVQADLASGVASGVRTTPTFFINGVQYEGPTDERGLLEALEAAIRAHRLTT